MATDIVERGEVLGRETLVRPPGNRVSWGAIFSGLFATLGIWALLSAFGSALGFTIFRMGPGVAREGMGLFSTIWALATPLLAFFVGGLVAGRLSGAFTRTSGMLHGLVMWSLSGLVMVALGGIFLDVNNLLLTLQTGDGTAFLLWGLVGALTLSLLAAMLGAGLGVTHSETQVQSVRREVLPVRERREVVQQDLVGGAPGPAAYRSSGTRTQGRSELHAAHEEALREDARRVEVRGDEGRFDDRRRSAGAGAALLGGAGLAGTAAARHERVEARERGEGVAARAGLGREEEVPRERWADLLEALSEIHRNDPVRVEVAGAERGRRPLIDRSPLMGLELDGRGPDRPIDIVVGSGSAVFDHRITQPRHLYFHEDLADGTADLAIEDAAHTRTLIHFSPVSSQDVH